MWMLAAVGRFGWLGGAGGGDVVDQDAIVVAKDSPLAVGGRLDRPRFVDEMVPVFQRHQHPAMQPNRFLQHVDHVAAVDDVTHGFNSGDSPPAEKVGALESELPPSFRPLIPRERLAASAPVPIVAA